jgi:hypothetical protein
VYRMNETGVEGIWACQTHAGTPIDPDLLAITKDLKEAMETPRKGGWKKGDIV